MNFTTYSPSALLKPFVDKYMIIQSDLGMENHILPDTSVVMAFRLTGRISLGAGGNKDELPRTVITGLQNTSRWIRYSRQSATFLVAFREGGAAAFIKEPVHELFGLHAPVEYLIPGRQLQETEERLAKADSNRQRVAIMETFLLSQLEPDNIQPDPLIHHSIEQIKSSNGILKIKDLVADLPLSRDPFEKRFRRVVGTSPKQFSGIVRLRHIINHHSKEKKLTETAYSAGYFDQAHFIKDFKSFTGQTPGDFFDSPSFW